MSIRLFSSQTYSINMNTHVINLPFLALNAYCIAVGIGSTPLHIGLYLVQGYFYIKTLIIERRYAEIKREYTHLLARH